MKQRLIKVVDYRSVISHCAAMCTWLGSGESVFSSHRISSLSPPAADGRHPRNCNVCTGRHSVPGSRVGKRPSHPPNALWSVSPGWGAHPGVCALSQDRVRPVSFAPTLLVPTDSSSPVQGQEGEAGRGLRCQEVEESTAISASRGGGW